MNMAEATDLQNTQPRPGAGLSFALLRRAAVMLLLISAPAFLITLQMRRHDLRRAVSSDLAEQNLSELRGIVSQANGDCMEAPASARPIVREAGLDASRPQNRSHGLAVLLSPAHALAAVNERVRPIAHPCGGV